MSLPSIPLALATVNLVAFAAFGLDKAAATSGDRRISEATLLWLAFFGGSGGAVLAQQVFRHKTRKEPFRSILLAIAFAHVGFAIVWLVSPQRVEAGIRGVAAQIGF